MRVKHSRFSRATFFSAFLLLIILAAPWGCDREPGIIVDIPEWPTGVERLSVRPSLNGIEDAGLFINKDQNRFVVRLPAGSEGMVRLDAVGMDPMGCKLASGSLTIEVPTTLSHFAEETLDLSLLASPVCVLAGARLAKNGDFSADFMAAGNFNADRFPDLAVIDAQDHTFGVLLGNGAGGFTFNDSQMQLGNLASAVAVTDFDGDTKPDLAVTRFAAAGTDNLMVLLGDGKGGFAISPFNAGPYPTSVAAADFDGDLTLDLAVANNSTNYISILRGDGKRGFGSPMPVPLNDDNPRPLAVAVGDFNDDRHPDLAVLTARVPENVVVLLNDGTGRFGPAIPFSAGLAPKSVVVDDFNRDKKLDLAIANSGAEGTTAPNGTISLLLGDGQGGFGPPRDFPVGQHPIALAIGDFNGDKWPDLAVANFGNGMSGGDDKVSVLLNDSQGGFFPTMNFPVEEGSLSVVVEDFNGDRKPDLAVANSGPSNAVSILLNQY